ncbi:MAG: AIPR family protein [Streptococcus thermophilus]
MNSQFNFKAIAVRTIDSPSQKGVTTYFAYVNFRDLPSDLPMEVNPRQPKMTTAVAKSLINAVKSSDTDFDINNRGIVIVAKKFKFIPNQGLVTLDLGEDPQSYGILDGGHTYRAIIENRDQVHSGLDKFVKLEIIVGEELTVSRIADARNTSAQVSDIALFELDDKFDLIKESISNEKYSSDIAYKDNENKRVPIAELLRLMFTFNIKRFPDDSNAPVSAYSGKQAVFKDYQKEFESDSNIYEKLAPFLPDLVDLYELIQRELPNKYQEYKNAEGKNAAFGRIRGVEGSGNYLTDFTQQTINYNISTGFLMPIFGSFRALLRESDGVINWEFNPKDVWKIAGTRLVQNTFDTDTNPQQVGKSKTLWQANYRIVDSVRKDLLLDKLLNERK